jgi:hypothetical protein
MSNQDVKNNYCTRYYRTTGDADGNNAVDNLDYFYYVRFVNGGQVPDEINPDFNGDGVVSVSDRKIVVRTLGDIVAVPTAPPEVPVTGGVEPSVTGSISPSVTSVITPTAGTSVTPTLLPTVVGGVCPFNYFCSSALTCQLYKWKLSTQPCVQAGVPGFCCTTGN